MSDYLEKFLKERNEALLSLDRKKIERFAKKYSVPLPSSDEAFWRGVHKTIYNVTAFPPEVRQKSEIWLLEHGSTTEIT